MTWKQLINWQCVYSQLYRSIDNRKLQLYMESSVDSRDNQSWLWQLTSRQLTSRQSKVEWDIWQGGNSIESYNTSIGWRYVFSRDGQTILLRVVAWGRDVESTTRQACVEPAGAVSIGRSNCKRRRLSDTIHMIRRLKNAGFGREQGIYGANGLLTTTGTQLSAWRRYSGSARISLKRWRGRIHVPLHSWGVRERWICVGRDNSWRFHIYITDYIHRLVWTCLDPYTIDLDIFQLRHRCFVFTQSHR